MSVIVPQIVTPLIFDATFDGRCQVASLQGLAVGATVLVSSRTQPDKVGKIGVISGAQAIVYGLAQDAHALDLSAYRVSDAATLTMPSQAVASAPASSTNSVSVTVDGYGSTASFQDVAGDLTLSAGAGKNHPDTAFLAPVMGNLMGASLTKTGNYLGGVIGEYSVAGVRGTHYPSAGVLGLVGDGAGKPRAAVMASIDGDSGAVNADAMFGVSCQNSNVGSGADFGLDLQDAAHDGYLPVDAAFYGKAPVRIVSNVCVLVGAGAPVDGTTGDNVAGPGSLYVDTTGANLYVQVSLITTPVWKLVTRAA